MDNFKVDLKKSKDIELEEDFNAIKNRVKNFFPDLTSGSNVQTMICDLDGVLVHIDDKWAREVHNAGLIPPKGR